MPDNSVRTRFAPSPTGAPHIGNIRTALFAWLFARHQGGKFILRIEDTDQKRAQEGSVEKILESLDWLGLDVDEGVFGEKLPARHLPGRVPGRGAGEDGKWKIKERGDKGPYFQSQRLDIYKKHAYELVKKGQAFYCFCSEERLQKAREKQMAQGKAAKYDGRCLRLSADEVKASINNGEKHVIRLRVPESGETRFNDVIRGQISVKNELIDNQVLLKSDGYPTYHLAVVVDDYLMKISHILRAEEWLPSTPKHILLYDYFGWEKPVFAHLPVVLGPDKGKLSKRHGAASVLEFREQGYLPDALINYLALLGWNPKTDQEILSRLELTAQFSLEKINKANPIFDVKKLNWLNQQYIKKMPADELALLIPPPARGGGKEGVGDGIKIHKAISLVQDRMETLKDFEKLTEFLYKKELNYDAKILLAKKLDKNQTRALLEKALTVIENSKAGEWKEEKLRQIFFQYLEDNNIKRGDLLWPLRVAVTGLEKSPDVFGAIAILGKEKTIARVEQALILLN